MKQQDGGFKENPFSFLPTPPVVRGDLKQVIQKQEPHYQHCWTLSHDPPDPSDSSVGTQDSKDWSLGTMA